MRSNTGSGRFTYGTLAFAAMLAVGSSPATWAQSVTSSGSVSPPFASAPVVDLTGQSIFIGGTNGNVGTQGTVSVTGGGSLTAAQIVPGTGGLGSGTVVVNGAGSVIHLTGGAASNGLDIGSWGTGTVSVSNGGSIACASLACAFNDIGNAAGSTGTLNINGGSVSGLGQLAVGLGNLSATFGTPGASTTATLTITNGGTLSTTGFSSVASNSGQAGLVTGNLTINGVGSSWNITRDLANGGAQAGLSVANAANTSANVTISNGGNLTVTGARATPATDNSVPFIELGGNTGASASMTVTTGGSVRFAGDSGVFNVGGDFTRAGGNATLNITAGGTVAGLGTNGLTFMEIGQNSATGTVNVSGAGSQLTLSGVGGQNASGLQGLGALLEVGRNRGFGGGTGSLNVTNGGSVVLTDAGQVASTGSMGLIIADAAASTGIVTVSGAGSSILVSSSGGSATVPYVLVGNGGEGQMTISNGATVSVLGNGERNFTVGNSATGSGTLNLNSGGVIVASRFAVADNGGVGAATVDNATINLDGVIITNGVASGAGVRVGRGVGANALLTLQNGAVVNIDNTVSGAGFIIGGTSVLSGGTGTVTMSGASKINFTGTATGASLQVGGIAGTGVMTMTGNSLVDTGATGNVLVAASTGSTGNLTIGGGSIVKGDNGNIGGNSDTVVGGNGTVLVTGVGSLLQLSGDSGFLGVGRSGTGALTVSNLGQVAANAISVGRGSGGIGTLLVDNGTINLTGQETVGNLAGADLAVGSLGGTGTATLTNGSHLSVTNLGTAGAFVLVGGTQNNPLGDGTLTVSGGSTISVVAGPGLAGFTVGRDGSGTASFSGNSTIDIGDGSTTVGRFATGTGTLTLASGSTLAAGNVFVGGNSDTVAGGIGNVTVTGVGSAITASGASGLISVGVNGSGSLSVSNQATLSGIVLSVGRDAGGTGNLTVDHSTVNLAGQQTVSTLYGAGLSIGNAGGTGSATITNGSTVTISNPGTSGASLYVGGTPGSPTGSGSLSVTNSQISVFGATPPAAVAGQTPPTGSAKVVVGYDGTGTVTLNNSTLQVGNPVTLHDGNFTLAGGDGSLIVASQPGSTGTLSLNNNSLVKAGYIGIGVSQPGVIQPDGSVVQSNGGAGHLIVNNSSINTTTLEIGSQGILSGDGGVINAAGGVIVGGTISPGNSPGRMVINCDLTFLPGSKLILDVQDNGAGGFNVDHLILGPTANFSFSNVQVDFNFLGATDPTAFLNSGDFKLDTFIEAGDLTSFAPLAGARGVDWSDLFNATQFIATAGQGTINNFVFTPPGANDQGGSVTFTTAAVPEVSTWMMMALGLLLLAAAARNRRQRV